MKKILSFLLCMVLAAPCFGANLSALNGKTISGWNGKTWGTSSGNINAWNGLLASGGGGAPITFINSTSGNLDGGAGQSTCAASAISITAGNSIVVGVSEYHAGTTISGVTDSSGNTYTKCGNTENGDAAHDAEIWIATNVSASASNVITATFSGPTEYVNVLAAQYSGIAASSPCDASAGGSVSSAGTSHTSSTTATTAVANEVVVGLWMDWAGGGTLSAGTATNMRVTNSGGALTDKIVSSTGTQTNALTTQNSTQMFSMVRTFKGASQ